MRLNQGKSYVLHLQPDTHERWKEHCRTLGRRMSDLAGETLEQVMREAYERANAQPVPVAEPVQALPPKADAPKLDESTTGAGNQDSEPPPPDPWGSLPFWKRPGYRKPI